MILKTTILAAILSAQASSATQDSAVKPTIKKKAEDITIISSDKEAEKLQSPKVVVNSASEAPLAQASSEGKPIATDKLKAGTRSDEIINMLIDGSMPLTRLEAMKAGNRNLSPAMQKLLASDAVKVQNLPDITFKDAPFWTVVRLLAKQAHLSYIVPEAQAKKGSSSKNNEELVTVEMFDIHPAQALEVILNSKGYSMEVDNLGVCHFVSHRKLKSYSPKFLSEAEILPILEILKERLSEPDSSFKIPVKAKDGEGAHRMPIILSASDRFHDTFSKFLDSYDKPESHVYMDVQVIEITRSPTSERGFNWKGIIKISDMLLSLSVSNGALSANLVDNNAGEILPPLSFDPVGGAGGILEELFSALPELAGAESQLNETIDANTEEIESLEQELSFAQNRYDTLSAQYLANPGDTTIVSELRSAEDELTSLNSEMRTTRRTHAREESDLQRDVDKFNEYKRLQEEGELSAVIEAVNAKSNSDLITSTRINMRSGETREIKSGDQVPYSKVSRDGGTQSNAVSSSGIEFIDSGIQVEVSPEILGDDIVRCEVNVSASVFLGEKTISADGITAPIKAQRDIASNILMRSGKTSMIGGLVTSNYKEVKRSVPVLGDIPLLGFLFQYSRIEKEEKDVIVLVTPTVYDAAKGFDVLLNKNGRKAMKRIYNEKNHVLRFNK